MHHKTAEFTVKALTDTGRFTGWASVYGVKDRQGEIVQKGAFTASLQDYARRGNYPALLLGHDMQNPVGAIERIRESEQGVEIEGQIDLGVEAGQKAYELVRSKSLHGLSVGFQATEKTTEKGVPVIKQADLLEVSLVAVPANQECVVTSVKSLRPSDIEKALRDAGLTRRQAKAVLADGFKAIGPRDAQAFEEISEHAENLLSRLRNLQ